jgi:hypothetical protein
MSPVMIDPLTRAGSQEHAAHRAPPGLADQAHQQDPEQLESRRGKTTPERLQENSERRRYGQTRKHQQELA